MSARAIPARSQGLRAKRVPSVDSVRSARPSTGEIAKPSRLQTPKPQPTNGNAAFDPEAFLARTGLGRKSSHSEEEMRWPTRKAILPTRFFTCRRAG